MSSRLRTQPPLQLRSEQSIANRARTAVMQLIVREGLKAGDRLPSEAELSATFNISRPSLREALKLLEQEGLISTRHGLGRFLSAAAALQVERPITAYESITSMLRELGFKPETRVISIGEEPADKDVARSLRCRAGAPVLRLERLRHQAGQPLVYRVEFLRRDSLPEGFDKAAAKASLNELLERAGRRPRMSSASVSAVDLPPRVARLLGRKHRRPWLLITETCFTDRGEPVIFARDYHRGDAFSFNFSRR
jgi:GntR family transcriptional regulator